MDFAEKLNILSFLNSCIVLPNDIKLTTVGGTLTKSVSIKTIVTGLAVGHPYHRNQHQEILKKLCEHPNLIRRKKIKLKNFFLPKL